jgi:hypothetical protein
MRSSFLVGLCNPLYRCNLNSVLLVVQKAQIFRRFEMAHETINWNVA